MNNKNDLAKILNQEGEKAQEVASKNMDQIKNIIGF
jgi:hypothetical protein